MRSSPVPLLLVVVAFAAYAGTRYVETDGHAPAALADGGCGTSDSVGLGEVVGCRMSIRVPDSGTINGGTLYPYYCDPAQATGWAQSNTLLKCSLEANKLADGGAPASQVCPDLEVLGRFGRLGALSWSVVGADGGTPNGFGVDGGQNVPPVVRVECWGPQLP